MKDIERRIERRLKLQDLRVLISVVESGSMHKAAERLGTSQPAVSRAIGDLEQAVGVRLLDRSPHGIEPTQYGRALIKRGVAIFDELRQSVKDIEFLSDPSTGELRIGCSDMMAAGPVSTVIERLAGQHPRLVFHIVTGATAYLYRELMERNVDFVIGRVNEAVPEGLSDVGGLFDDTVIVAAGAHNRWTRRRKVNLEELVDEPWTLPTFDSEMGAIVVEAFRARGLTPPQAAVVTGSTNTRNRLVTTGPFLTVIPEFALTLPGKNPALRAVPVDLPNARRTMRIISASNRSLSPLADLFIDSMRVIAKPLKKGGK